MAKKRGKSIDIEKLSTLISEQIAPSLMAQFSAARKKGGDSCGDAEAYDCDAHKFECDTELFACINNFTCNNSFVG